MEPLFSFKYTIPYFSFLLILIILFFKGNEYINNNKSFLKIRIITLCLILIFIGLRGHIYSDWISYYLKFQTLPTLWKGNIASAFLDKQMEPGFVLYSIMVKSFFPNYFIWVFINTIIDLWILDTVFKKYSKYYILAFIVFFVMNGLFIEFNLYRNSKAIMLFLLSLDHLKNRKFIPFLLINLVGVTFHYSALLFIPLYFILNKEIPKTIVWIIFVLGNIVFLFHLRWLYLILGDFVNLLNIQAVTDKTLGHSNSGVTLTFSMGYFERIISFILFTLYYKKLVTVNESYRVFYNIFLCYFIFFIFFSEVRVFSERFSVLFIASYWILYPGLFALIHSRQKRYLYIFVFFAFAFLRTYTANQNIMARYDNLLWGIESYDQRSWISNTYSDFFN